MNLSFNPSLRYSSHRLLAIILICWWSSATGDELPAVDCVITPFQTIDISSAVPGVLANINVERSDLVSKRQEVAQLESGVEQADLELAKAKAALDSEIHASEVNLSYDRLKQGRLNTIDDDLAIADQEKDDAERNVALSSWRLKQARETRLLRQLELRRAEERLKQKSIRSPIDGIVVQRFKSTGEYVEDQPILRVAQIDPLYVEAIVPIELFGKITLGMPADVYPESLSTEAKRATVSIVDRMADAASGTFGVRLSLPNPDLALPAGMKCNLQFLADQRPKQANNRADPKRTLKDLETNKPTSSLAPIAPQSQHQEGSSTRLTEAIAQPQFAAKESPADTLAAPQCWKTGPIRSASQASELQSRMQQQGFSAQIQQTQQQQHLGYIILAPRQASRAASRQLANKMKNHGVKDVLLMGSGAYKDRISLGTYNGPVIAAKRQQQVSNLGFSSERIERTHTVDQWQLLISPQADPPATQQSDLIFQLLEDEDVVLTDCPAELIAEQ